MSYVILTLPGSGPLRGQWPGALSGTAATNPFGIAGAGTNWLATDALVDSQPGDAGYAAPNIKGYNLSPGTGSEQALVTSLLRSGTWKPFADQPVAATAQAAKVGGTIAKTDAISTRTFTFGMGDQDWGDIRNIELWLGKDITLKREVNVTNFVDVHVKVGDAGTTGLLSWNDQTTVTIQNLKRGEVDLSTAGPASVSLKPWSDASSVDTIYTTGSAARDYVSVTAGDRLQYAPNFAPGGDTGKYFGTGGTGSYLFHQVPEGIGWTYDGTMTRTVTQLGFGDDTFNAQTTLQGYTGFSGTALTGVATVREFMSADVVWGQSGNDILYGGGGRDILFGDFGDLAGFTLPANVPAYALAARYDPVTQAMNGSVLTKLYRKAGNDYLGGGSGDDILMGGGDTGVLTLDPVTLKAGVNSGGDSLNPGTGTDLILYRKGDGFDYVQGMEWGIDTIQVAGFTAAERALAKVGALTTTSGDVAVVWLPGNGGFVFLDTPYDATKQVTDYIAWV